MRIPWLCSYNEKEFNQLKENHDLLMTAFNWDACTIYLHSKGIKKKSQIGTVFIKEVGIKVN